VVAVCIETSRIETSRDDSLGRFFWRKREAFMMVPLGWQKGVSLKTGRTGGARDE